jgi:hypothetical protein
MPLPLQHATRDQAAGQMMPLSPLGPRLTTSHPALIRADAEHCLEWRTRPIEAADCRGRQCQTLGRVVRGAVSDDPDLEPPCSASQSRPHTDDADRPGGAGP